MAANEAQKMTPFIDSFPDQSPTHSMYPLPLEQCSETLQVDNDCELSLLSTTLTPHLAVCRSAEHEAVSDDGASDFVLAPPR